MQQQDHINALVAGARLRDYRIERLLGAGGFGITYKAIEDVTDRPVAIKEYLPSALAARARDGTTVRPISEAAREDFDWGLSRFRNEAKLLISLRHPNIVHVLSYFEAHGTGYLVMAFQSGHSLGELVAKGGTLPEAQLLRIMGPLLDGIEAVHAQGFLHRDIKPDNVYIREDGAPVLLDFGAARQALGQHSRSLTAVLTEGYAPYEQYERDGDQGPWSDVYALGALMFRCLLGKIPPDAPQRISARLRDRPDPIAGELARLREICAPRTAAAVAAALGTTEKDRPQSVARLRDMLAAPFAPAEKSQSEETLLPGAAPAGNWLRHESNDAATVASRGRRRRVFALAAGVAALALAGGAAAYFTLSDDSVRVAENRRRSEDEARRKTEDEARRKAEQMARQQAEEESRRKAEEEARRKTEAEARKKAEETARQRADEERRRAEDESRKRAEEERRKAEDDARRKREPSAKADGLVAQARQAMTESRTMLDQNRFDDAKRMAERAASLLREGQNADRASTAVAEAWNELVALEGDIRRGVAERVVLLLREARQHIQGGRFDEAQKRVLEAKSYEPHSTEVAIVESELAGARKRAAETAKPYSRTELIGHTKRLYDSLMEFVAKQTSTTSNKPERVGKPIRYRGWPRNKALAMCFDWDKSTPAGVQHEAIGMQDGEPNEEAARSEALQSCRRLAVSRTCVCQIVDFNDRNVLIVPDSYISRHYR